MFKICSSGIGKHPRVAALAFLILLTSFPIPEQGNPSGQPGSDEYRISVDVGLVVLPVIITDRKGKVVSQIRA